MVSLLARTLTLLLLALLTPIQAYALFGLFEATVPSCAKEIAKELDSQLMMRYVPPSKESEGVRQGRTRANIFLMGTTMVNLNSLTQSCGVGRQMTEEISSRLMSMGYRYTELRKGCVIRFDRATGELILTRDVQQLASRYGKGQAVLAGTYVISDKHVRFTVSVILLHSNEVIAKASGSVPITEDLLPLLDEQPVFLGGGKGSMTPSVHTRLR